MSVPAFWLLRRHLTSVLCKVTKRYIVRVSKAWYSLASPFLFEYIFLGRGRVLGPLRDGMLRSEQAVKSQEILHTIGWQTQRLDVHMRDRTDNPQLIMDILADILRRLPNLRVLTFAVVGHGYDSQYLPENILQATNPCRDTLRFLNWYGGLRPSSNTWASFLENHPKLEAINAPVFLTKLENSHIVLDSLKSVYIHCHPDPDLSATHIGDELWNINFPNIHHAIYDITTTPSYFVHDDFLPKIGPKLTSIQINCLKNFYAIDDIHVAFFRALIKIEATCTNLVRVDLLTHEWNLPLGLFPYCPKTVHTLGIRVHVHQIPKRSLRSLFTSLRNLLMITSLKTICFMDQDNVRALRSHPQALSSQARILNEYGECGFNIVDHEGRSLL